MRVLFTNVPSSGHFQPLVPLAVAVRGTGHHVAFACAESMRRSIEALGFTWFGAGLARDGDGDREFARLKDRARVMTPGVEMETLAIAQVLYGVRARRMVPDLMSICERWKPDVIVRESFEAAGAIVAERLDVPQACIQIAPLYDIRPMHDAMVAQLDRARAMVGLPSDPELAMLGRSLHFCFAPPSLLDPDLPAASALHHLRSVLFDASGPESLPPWVFDLPPRPTVYVTFGTVAHRWIADSFQRLVGTILSGLRDEQLNIIVTVGRDTDPADLGRQPANVHVERYIPQTLLLPHCSAVISHCGMGTLMTVIDAGLPQVMIPLLADDYHNSRRCAEIGLGPLLDHTSIGQDDVRSAVEAALGAPGYSANARRLRDEMHDLPGTDYAVELLEEMATARFAGC